MFGEKKPTDEINVRSRIFKHCINQGDNLIVRPSGHELSAGTRSGQEDIDGVVGKVRKIQ
jgi:hypothetical protein